MQLHDTSEDYEPHGVARTGCKPSLGFSADEIREFQRLLREHSDVTLDDAEATIRANELAMFYRVLLGPIPEDNENPADPESSNVRALARFGPRKLP